MGFVHISEKLPKGVITALKGEEVISEDKDHPLVINHPMLSIFLYIDCNFFLIRDLYYCEIELFTFK